MRRLAAVALACLTVVGCSDMELPVEGEPADGVVRTGQFNVLCGVGHRNNDDPIVFPGQPGASHEHQYFGAVGVDAFTTTEDLLAGETTCGVVEDHAAYWVPSVFKDGVRVVPTRFRAYYRAGHVQQPVQRPPIDLKFIAGNAQATGYQSASVTTWQCSLGGSVPKTRPLLASECSAGEQTMMVRFPNCWNGTQYDSADHKAHMAYATGTAAEGKVCPASHPVAIPQLQYVVGIPAMGPLSLSSGPDYTLHADFWNAWIPERLQGLIDDCLNASVDCGNVTS